MSGDSKLARLFEDGAPVSAQRAALVAGLRERGVSEDSVDIVMRYVRDGVALSRELASGGRTRLGGAAVLPAGEPWPRTGEESEWHLGFLALIDLDELPHSEPLPATGTLLMFQEMEVFGLDYDPLVATRVFYVPEGADVVVPPEPEKVVWPVTAVSLGARALPVAGEAEVAVRALAEAPDRDLVITAMDELVGPLMKMCRHTLLGSPIERRWTITEGLIDAFERFSPASREKFSPRLLAAEGWRLLAQFGSEYDEQLGLDFVSSGTVYFCIPEEDLAACRFDRVVAHVQWD